MQCGVCLVPSTSVGNAGGLWHSNIKAEDSQRALNGGGSICPVGRLVQLVDPPGEASKPSDLEWLSCCVWHISVLQKLLCRGTLTTLK